VIEHVIRNKDGGTSEVSQTPIKAIRHHCIECVGFVKKDVKECTSPLCSLFPYRFGKAPGHKGKGMVNNLN
jgi:hypothetical protein